MRALILKHKHYAGFEEVRIRPALSNPPNDFGLAAAQAGSMEYYEELIKKKPTNQTEMFAADHTIEDLMLSLLHNRDKIQEMHDLFEQVLGGDQKLR